MIFFSLPICLIRSLIATSPLGTALLVPAIVIYYFGTRAIWKSLSGSRPDEKPAPTLSEMSKDPSKLYNETSKFFAHLAEFIVLVGLLGWAYQGLGLIRGFATIFYQCLGGPPR